MSPSSSPNPLSTSLRDLLAILFRRKWTVLVILVSGLAGGVAWLFVIRDPAYEVSAKLLVRFGSEQGVPTTVLDQRPVFIPQGQQFVASEVDLLHNRDLLARVVDKLHLDQPPPPAPPPESLVPRLRYEARRAVRAVKELYSEVLIRIGLRERLDPRERAIAVLGRSLEVAPQRNSNVILATLALPVRQGASQVLNTLLEMHQTFRLEAFEDRSAVDFFSAKVKDLERRLREAETRQSGYEAQKGIQALEEQKRVLLTAATDVEAAEQSARVLYQRSAERARRVEALARSPEPSFSSVGSFEEGSFAHAMLLQLAELQRERDKLRLNAFDSDPKILNNRSQFETLMGLLRSNLAADVAEKQAALETRSREALDLRSRLDHLQSAQMEWTALQRSGKALEESYLFYRRKLEETEATQAMRRDRIGSVTVIEHAMDAVQEKGPSKTTLLGLVLAATIFLALAWVAVAEFFDHRLHGREDLEQALPGVPVIAALPALGSLHAPPPAYADALREAATFLAVRARQEQVREFVVASASTGEGVATVAAGVARELRRELGLRVLLAEFDLEHPSLAILLGLDPERGVQAVADGRLGAADAVQNGPDGLEVVVATPEAPPVTAARAVAALDGLRRGPAEGCDLLLVEAPALLTGGLAIALAKQIPRVVLVVEADRTRLEVLQRVTRDLEQAGIRLVAAVLNKQRRVLPGWLHRWVAG